MCLVPIDRVCFQGETYIFVLLLSILLSGASEKQLPRPSVGQESDGQPRPTAPPTNAINLPLPCGISGTYRALREPETPWKFSVWSSMCGLAVLSPAPMLGKGCIPYRSTIAEQYSMEKESNSLGGTFPRPPCPLLLPEPI